MKRFACVALAASLLMAQSGCVPSQEVAAEKAGRVRVGMTRAEVIQALGTPDTRVYNLRGDAQEVWDYQCGQALHPNPWKVVLGIVLVLGIVALAAATNGGIFPSGGSSETKGDFGVRVLFDAEAGVVRRVTVTPPP